MALAGLPHRVPLIVAAAGESAEDYVARGRGPAAVRRPRRDQHLLAQHQARLRLVRRGPTSCKDLFRAVRGATRKPVIVKISPDFRETNEEITIPAALDAGITIVNYGNTRRVDEPRLSQRSGGLSGPALFATTLENVRRVRERFGDRLEIIATGGIDSPEKARQALAAGATACGDLHRIHHAGPAAGAPHPRCAATRRKITHRLSTYPQRSTIAENARSDAVPEGAHENVTL